MWAYSLVRATLLILYYYIIRLLLLSILQHVIGVASFFTFHACRSVVQHLARTSTLQAVPFLLYDLWAVLEGNLML